MTNLDPIATLSLAALASVTGGADDPPPQLPFNPLNFDQSPAALVAQTRNRITGCRALEAEAKNAGSWGESMAYNDAARQCWDSIKPRR